MGRHGSDVSAGRGVGGNGGEVRRVDALSLGGGSQSPLDFLHVGVPDVVPRLTSPGGSRNENEDVSKKYYPGEEATRSDGLSESTEEVSATNDTTEGGNSHSAGGEPQDPENRQPANLKGNPGRGGAITDATDGEHGESRRHVEEGSRETEGREDVIKTAKKYGLVQRVRGEREDKESKAIGRPENCSPDGGKGSWHSGNR